MKYILVAFGVFLSIYGCPTDSTPPTLSDIDESSIVEKITTTSTHNFTVKSEGKTIKDRFPVPKGFTRFNSGDTTCYAHYLQQLPLKPIGTEVQYYNGRKKANNGVYEAVVDLPIGKKDLHQCADAVMRLRAEYLFQQQAYAQIHFNFTNGFKVDFTEWMKGKRVVVKGNKTYWQQKTIPSNTYQDLWNYLEVIFTYAGTYSLSKELQPVSKEQMRIGDVFIQGGFPGHAVIVVDMAINLTTNEQVFMLAQSYMPAQELQILSNPYNKDLSPWYSANLGELLYTPEWNFATTDLKRFVEKGKVCKESATYHSFSNDKK